MTRSTAGDYGCCGDGVMMMIGMRIGRGSYYGCRVMEGKEEGEERGKGGGGRSRSRSWRGSRDDCGSGEGGKGNGGPWCPGRRGLVEECVNAWKMGYGYKSEREMGMCWGEGGVSCWAFGFWRKRGSLSGEW